MGKEERESEKGGGFQVSGGTMRQMPYGSAKGRIRARYWRGSVNSDSDG